MSSCFHLHSTAAAVAGPYLRFCFEGRVYQFRALCFGLSLALQVFTRVFTLISKWAHWGGGGGGGVAPPSLSGRLAGHCGDVVSSSAASRSCSPVVQGPGYCGQLGEVRPPAFHSCPVSGDADRHVSREGVPVQGSSDLFSGCGDFLPGPTIAPSVHVTCLITWFHWSRFSLGVIHACALCTSRTTGPPWWTILPSRPLCRQSAWRWFVGGSRRTGRCLMSFSRFLLHPCCCISTRLSGWEARPLDLTASGVWSQEESSLHISLLEMKAVVLALAPFLPQLLGQSVILMSDNATVVAYLRNQGSGTISRVLCRIAAVVVLWAKYYSVSLTGRYIPGKKNVLADQLSHPDQVLPTEWSFLLRSSMGFVGSSVIPISTSLPPMPMPSFRFTSRRFWTQWHGSRTHSSFLGTVCWPLPFPSLLSSGRSCRECVFRLVLH